MFRRAVTLTGVTLGLVVASAAHTKPVAGWWSGGAMGDIENGYSDGNGTEVLFSCNPGRGHSLYLSAKIRGVSPRGEFVVFSVDDHDFEFTADRLGSIEMTSRPSVNSMYFLWVSEIAGWNDPRWDLGWCIAPGWKSELHRSRLNAHAGGKHRDDGMYQA